MFIRVVYKCVWTLSRSTKYIFGLGNKRLRLPSLGLFAASLPPSPPSSLRTSRYSFDLCCLLMRLWPFCAHLKKHSPGQPTVFVCMLLSVCPSLPSPSLPPSPLLYPNTTSSLPAMISAIHSTPTIIDKLALNNSSLNSIFAADPIREVHSP